MTGFMGKCCEGVNADMERSGGGKQMLCQHIVSGYSLISPRFLVKPVHISDTRGKSACRRIASLHDQQKDGRRKKLRPEIQGYLRNLEQTHRWVVCLRLWT